jgi:hypothetical protein
MLNKAMRERTDFGFEQRIVLPDGSIKHVYSIAHRVIDDSDTLVEYIGTVMDVISSAGFACSLRRVRRTGSWWT